MVSRRSKASRFPVEMDPEVHREFSELCAARRIPMAVVVRELLSREIARMKQEDKAKEPAPRKPAPKARANETVNV